MAMTTKIRTINHLQFGVIAPEEARGMSVTQQLTMGNKLIPRGITRPESVVSGDTVYGGVNDTRMGNTFDKEHPGSFGHIELFRPVYHVGFMNAVVMILRCVSFYTSELLVERDDPTLISKLRLANFSIDPDDPDPTTNRNGKERLHIVMNECVTRQVCLQTGRPQPKYRRDGLRVFMQFRESLDRSDIPLTGDHRQVLEAIEALRILSKMSDDTVRFLGLNPLYTRPEWLIITVLAVPPPHVRPSVAMSATSRCEDDLTHKLSDIVKANLSVGHSLKQNDPDHVIQQYTMLLQYHVATFYDNQLKNQPVAQQRSGKPLRTLRQRLVGKEGRVRGNLMGKRVDFSARTVITADPNLSIDQVGVPKSIAMNLTVPDRVNRHNIEELKECIRRGPTEHPGARYIIRPNGRRVDLRYMKSEMVDSPDFLEEGCIVERHLRNDDVVLFNRQPSLHKMSIMAHRVRVMEWSTFRMNLAVTAPYNADFDGDEMNIHVPQSVLARAEAETLMMPNKVIVSSQSNRPVMGIVQDSLLSATKMTQKNVFLEREEVYNLFMQIDSMDVPIPAIFVPDKEYPNRVRGYWTGKQVMSAVIPSGTNLRRTSNGHDASETFPDDLNPQDTTVIISNGELLTGRLDKKTLGATSGGLIHIVYNDRGPEMTRVMMDQIQKLTNHYILHHGFTISIQDAMPDIDTQQSVHETLTEAHEKVSELIQQYHNKTLEQQPGRSYGDSLEEFISMRLNTARDSVGKRAESVLTFDNNFKSTVTSGSKGSFLNISQIMACVGQQSVEGKRVPLGFQGRSLPHFLKHDLRPLCRGFVASSYIKGLRPDEFFFHAMSGREGLIDTACKTAETGYIQRRLVKALEDVIIRYDGTVRNGMGHIIQFFYGDDNLDGASVEFQTIPHYGAPMSKIHAVYSWNGGPHESETSASVKLKQEFEDIRLGYLFIYSIKDITSNSIPLPVPLERILQSYHQQQHQTNNESKSIEPERCVDMVNEFIQWIQSEYDPYTTLLFVTVLRLYCASKRIVLHYKFSEQTFRKVLLEVRQRYGRSISVPGESCGVLAAQSIGEPATQMTLNTFHYAGVSSKNVTLGVPRLKEIINGAKTVRTPYLTIHLEPAIRESLQETRRVANEIEYFTMSKVLMSSSIVYDPVQVNEPYTVIQEDQNMLEMHMIWISSCKHELSEMSPWILRLEFDYQQFHAKMLTFETIIEKINDAFGDTFDIIHTDPYADRLIMRLRMCQQQQQQQERGRARSKQQSKTKQKEKEGSRSKSVVRRKRNMSDPEPAVGVSVATAAAAGLESDPEEEEEDDEDPSAANNNPDNDNEDLNSSNSNSDSEDDNQSDAFSKEENSDNESLGASEVEVADADETSSLGLTGTAAAQISDEVFLQLVSGRLHDIRLRGVLGVKKVFLREIKTKTYDPEQGFVNTPGYIIDTTGSNLMGAMTVPGVCFQKTISNDCLEVFQTLGVEALRGSLLRELREIISFDSGYVNYRHLALLVDTMTSQGFLSPITRHGINRRDTGFLMRCSFEETVEVLLDAAIFSEKDCLQGVSENVMMGKTGPFGTGHFELYLNEDMLIDPNTGEAAEPVNPNAPTVTVLLEYIPSRGCSDAALVYRQAHRARLQQTVIQTTTTTIQEYIPSKVVNRLPVSPAFLPGRRQPVIGGGEYIPSKVVYLPRSPISGFFKG